MRAALLMSPGTVRCVDAPVRSPEPGEVIVRMSLASICGSDIHIVFDGTAGPPGSTVPGFPGHEGVGEVVESRDTSLAVGARVLTVPRAQPATEVTPATVPAAFAQYQTLAASSCVPLPHDGHLPELLLAQQLGTVVHALRRWTIDLTGRSACVIGQGSAGLLFTSLLRLGGASRIVVADPVASRRELAVARGADAAIDPSSADLVDGVLEATGGAGADLVVEAVGSAGTIAATVAVAARDAHVLFYGVPPTGPLPFDVNTMFRKKLLMTSSFGAQSEPGLLSFRHALGLIERGDVDVEPFTRCVLPLERVHEAFALGRERPDGVFKVSIAMKGDRPS